MYFKINYRNMKPGLILAGILVFQAILLFPNLYTLPHWYWDDGVNMEVAGNLMAGELRLYSISYPFIPHPPLFFAVLGLFFKVFGEELLVLRFLTCLFSLMTSLVVFFVGRKIGGARTGLMGAFFFAVYPQNLYWSRIGFANSQLMFLGVLSLYFFLLDGGWRRISYVLASLCFLTEFTGAAFVFSVIILAYKKGGWRGACVAVAYSAVLPVIVYLLIYFSPAGNALVFDLVYVLERFWVTMLVFAGTLLVFAIAYSKRKPVIDHLREFYGGFKEMVVKDIRYTFGGKASWILSQRHFIILVMINLVLAARSLTPYTDELLFAGHDEVFFDYYWVGLVGILAAGNFILAVFVVPIFLITFALARTDHLILPLYPFFSIGLAVFLPKARRHLQDFLEYDKRKTWAGILALALIYYPFAAYSIQDVNSFTFANGFTRQDVEVIHKVAEYVNENTNNEDVVLTTAHIARLIDARGVEVFQGLAAEGVNISYFAKKLPAERFIFNSSYKNAKFVVLHNRTLGLMSECCCPQTCQELSSWPVIHRRGEILVYVNPSYDKSAVEDKPPPEY